MSESVLITQTFRLLLIDPGVKSETTNSLGRVFKNIFYSLKKNQQQQKEA